MFATSLLGEGTFSRVELVSAEIALKKFHSVSDFCAIREIAILNSINHPAIVNVSSVSKDPDGCIRMYMKAYPMTLDSPEYKKTYKHTMPAVIRAILSATSYLHKIRIWHRDIKPANILFDPATVQAVLCDFNISVFAVPSMRSFYGRVQSLYYRAPEINMLLTSVYGPGIDVYSIGAIAFELASGVQWINKSSTKACAAENAAIAFGLAPRHDHASTFAFIKSMTIKQAYAFVLKRFPQGPKGWLDFCSRMLHPDPVKRLTSAQALEYANGFAPAEISEELPRELFVLVAEPIEIKNAIDEKTDYIDPRDHLALQFAETRLSVKLQISTAIGEFYRKWVRIIEIKYYSNVGYKKICGSAEDFDIFCAAVYICWACTNDPILENPHCMKYYEKAIDVMSTIDWKPL